MSSSDSDSEGWLMKIEDDALEVDQEVAQRCANAAAFAEKVKKEQRVTHESICDEAGVSTIDTAFGPLYFTSGAAQQARPWDCSLVMVRYLESVAAELLQGKHIIELGCGLGLPGLAAAMFGARHVVLTDMAEALPGIQCCLNLNPSLRECAEGRVMLWGHDHDQEQKQKQKQLAGAEKEGYDVVLCSDLLYGDSSTAEKLCVTLCEVCPTPATTVIFMHEERYAGDRGAHFFQTVARYFSVEAVPWTSEHFQHFNIKLHRLRRKCSS